MQFLHSTMEADNIVRHHWPSSPALLNFRQKARAMPSMTKETDAFRLKVRNGDGSPGRWPRRASSGPWYIDAAYYLKSAEIIWSPIAMLKHNVCFDASFIRAYYEAPDRKAHKV